MKSAQALPVHLPGSAQLADGTPGSAAPTTLPPETTIPTETIADPTAPGFSQNGVVFVIGRFGTLGRCSGTSVEAPSFSLVITAGHCVHEGSHWMGTKWVFVPGYHYGQRPFGTFVAKWLGSTPQWLASENDNYDVGAAVVSRNEKGERLADAVGADRIAFNARPDRSSTSTATRWHSRSTARHCSYALRLPSRVTTSSRSFTPAPRPRREVRCDRRILGGWLDHRRRPAQRCHRNGYPDDPTTKFGPYFGRAVGKLFAMASRVR